MSIKKKSFTTIIIFIFIFVTVMILSLGACSGKTTNEQSDSSLEVEESTAADGSSDPYQQGVTEDSGGIQVGTVFKYWTIYDLPAHLPWMDNRGNALYFQIYDNLLYKYEMNGDDIRGNLAESWEVSEDGLIWVFKLKEDAYFTSGNQVNAEAFVKSWDAAKEYQGRYFTAVKSYEATDEFEITVMLKNSSPTFIYDLPMQPNCGVVDPVALEEFGSEDNRAAVGSGPYYIETYTSGQGFVLKANSNYHNPDKYPSIETCEIVVIPDQTTALIALMNDEIDCLNTVDIETYNTLIDAGWEIITVEDRVNPYWFNAREVEIFRDDAVREALCHMVDWQAVTDLVYDGLYPVSESYWAGPGMVPYSDKYTYNPELGLKILEEAGYKPEDIDFTMLADPDFTNQEIAIQSQLNELGLINVKTVTYDGATCYGMLKAGTYEMFPVHNGYGIESPLTPFMMGYLPESAQRIMWLDYIDEESYAKGIEIYNDAVTASDFDQYIEKVEELTTLIQDECLSMGGLHTQRFYAIPERYQNIHIASITGYIEFAYLRFQE